MCTACSFDNDLCAVMEQCLRDHHLPPATAPACSADGISLVDAGDVYRTDYGNNEYCTWTLTCSDDSLSPTLDFTAFQLEHGWDFLYIYAGSGTSGHSDVQLHGSTLPPSVQVAGDTMTVVFQSDGSVTEGGFAATFECAPFIDPDLCATTDLVVDWAGGFHSSGHAVFGAQTTSQAALDDLEVVIADPLDGCMGASNGSAAELANIVGSFADGSMIGKIALIRRGPVCLPRRPSMRRTLAPLPSLSTTTRVRVP